MNKQIDEYNKKTGRDIKGGGGSKGLLGSLVLTGLQLAVNEALGTGGGFSSLFGAGAVSGQTPQLSSSEAFNLGSRVCL
jgi:hypothetical protein